MANAFTHYFSNSSYFKKSGNVSSDHLDDGEVEPKSKRKHKKNVDPNEVIYPEMECQQIIKFDTWCRSICPSIGSGNGMLVADDNGILYAYHTSWSS